MSKINSKQGNQFKSATLSENRYSENKSNRSIKLKKEYIEGEENIKD